MYRRLFSTLLATLVVLAAPRTAHGQERGAAALEQLVRGLPVNARVLIIGAHPDDEDTQLIAWLARGHQVHTAYLSLTRGDGGQNIIGTELGESLGAIRSAELLAARAIDGGEQYFSRAYDFGFSKNATETFQQWDREALTTDVVRVIRAYRPHVIVSVWSGTRADGHGHHEAAGLLARDGYDHSADTVRFPTQLHGHPWAASKFYRGAWARALPATLTFNVGAYDPVLGRSPAELAAVSRSAHRSQGQGGLERRGVVMSRLTREATRVNDSTPAEQEVSLFDGIDTSLARVAAVVPANRAVLERAAARMAWVQRALDLRHPDGIVDSLAHLVTSLEFARGTATRCGWGAVRRTLNGNASLVECSSEQLDLDATLDRMLARTKQALLAAAGLAVEVTAAKELLAFGDSMNAQVTIHNRGRHAVRWDDLHLTNAPRRTFDAVEILPDSSATVTRQVMGLVDHRPWWTGGRNGRPLFVDTRSPVNGIAQVSYGATALLAPSVSIAEGSRRLSDATVWLSIGDIPISFSVGELQYRFADPVLGEQRRQVGGVPPLTLALDRGLQWRRANTPIDQRIRMSVRSHTTSDRTLSFRYLLPPGAKISGVPDTMTLKAGESREVFISLTGALPAGRHEFGIGAESDGAVFTEGFREINYPHIPPLRLYRSSASYVHSVDIKVPKSLVVAYVATQPDGTAQALREIGIPTTYLTPDELPLMDLARFTAIVIGPREYERAPELVTMNPRLLEWVRAGGTMVVQYGQYEMTQPGMMPFPIGLTRPASRVTIESAPVKVLDPTSKLLTWPNRLGPKDWDDWVQERALYMPTTIDPRYRTPIALNDPDEPENRGAILEATLGKGRYVYTSLSLFRQIPAGIEGGLRLFVNLLSAGLPPQ
jgi:LmbE family N-acetylglucosaminyl deacetylase